MVGRGFCPAFGQGLDRAALTGAGVGLRLGVEILPDNVEKGQAAFPVPGMVGQIERGEGGGRHAFALHLIQQGGEAVGEVEDRGAGGKIGLRLDQTGDELRQFEAAAERRDRGGKAGDGGLAEVGDKADAGQEQCALFREKRRDAALHAAGVDEKLDLRQRLGRL